MVLFLFQEAPGYGADVLRLWVSSVDYTGDVLIGPQVLRQMSDIYRKLRGTLRYLLANLHDWKVCQLKQSELLSSEFHYIFIIFYISLDFHFSDIVIPLFLFLSPKKLVIVPRFSLLSSF